MPNRLPRCSRGCRDGKTSRRGVGARGDQEGEAAPARAYGRALARVRGAGLLPPSPSFWSVGGCGSFCPVLAWPRKPGGLAASWRYRAGERRLTLALKQPQGRDRQVARSQLPELSVHRTSKRVRTRLPAAAAKTSAWIHSGGPDP